MLKASQRTDTFTGGEVMRDYTLLSDTKPAENAAQNFVIGHFTGDLAQGFQSVSDVQCNQLAGAAISQTSLYLSQRGVRTPQRIVVAVIRYYRLTRGNLLLYHSLNQSFA